MKLPEITPEMARITTMIERFGQACAEYGAASSGAIIDPGATMKHGRIQMWRQELIDAIQHDKQQRDHIACNFCELPMSRAWCFCAWCGNADSDKPKGEGGQEMGDVIRKECSVEGCNSGIYSIGGSVDVCSECCAIASGNAAAKPEPEGEGGQDKKDELALTALMAAAMCSGLCKAHCHKWIEQGNSLTMFWYKCERCGRKGQSHVSDEGDIYECKPKGEGE